MMYTRIHTTGTDHKILICAAVPIVVVRKPQNRYYVSGARALPHSTLKSYKGFNRILNECKICMFAHCNHF